MMLNLSSMLIKGGGVLIVLILLLWIVEYNKYFIDAEMFENNSTSML
ncbi:ASFV G ACD 00330 [African swine fever virus]|uniref:ASFV G ACD 00330 n=1 Tax=African swine fever virus TaxID=10497 RepID=A0A7S7KLI8_ASF|nr:ASFV G ACD 00330 [African swine fever virus]